MSFRATSMLVTAALVFVVHVPLLSARTNVVPVKVIIEAPKGESIAHAYVALVPPERPWSRPAAEKIGSGPSVILEVPEGEYRIMAGVRGKGIEITDRNAVLESRRNEFRVVLPATRAITGSVRDSAGRALSGVTIGDVNAFVEAPLGNASELAARYFASDWRTKSAEDGTWSLLLPEGTSNAVAAESAGYATAWRSQRDAGSNPIELVMHRGAMVRLAFDREAPEFVVTLTAKGETTSVPPAWQAQFWARRVLKKTLEWSSLLAGEYDIYAQQRDPRTFSQAVKLGTVTLESGATRELRLRLPPSKAAPKSVDTVLVKPIVRLDPASIVPFGRDSHGIPRSMPRIIEEVSGGTLLHLDTTGFTGPYFGTTSDRFVVLPVRDDGKVAVASILDLGGASLHIRTSNENLPLPIAGIATFHGCRRPETIALPVAVAKGGKITFPAPADCMSFVLDVEPFSPMVFSKQLSLGDPEWLGEFPWYAAGGAAVRVATEDGSAVVGATVAVSARTESGQSSVPIVEKTTGPDGWARFDRLPAGPELAVVARTTDGARSVIESIRADPTQQKVVDPLRMPKPANLVVEPKLDRGFLEQFPDGHILILFLEPLDVAAERRTVTVEKSDHVEFSRLLPGRWQLGAMITAGRGYHPVLGEQIEVKAGESRRVEALIKPLVFRGRVMGNIPDLAGNIDILSSKRSDLLPSVEVFSSGDFVAILPRRDTYVVAVRPRSTGQMIWVGNTPFLDPSQPVAVKLPQGVVVARLRADGRPLAGATVMARMQHQPTTDVPFIALPVNTGTDGEARIEGLLPGPWVVFVPKDGHAEKSVMVSDAEVVYADLDVTSGLAITGSVTETFGAPVSGAKVTCLLPGPDGVPYMRLAFTGSDGSFDMGSRVASRSMVLCSVTSFSGAQGYRVIAGEHARLTLPADPATLRVNSLPALDRFSSLWLVSRDGRVIEVSPYVPRLPGAVALTIPALAPEAWKLVRVSSPSEWMGLITGGGTLGSIVDITLKPDERKTVDLENAGRDTAPAK